MKKIFITLLTVSVIVFSMVGLASALTISGSQYTPYSGDQTYLDQPNYQWSGFGTDVNWDSNYPNNLNSAADIRYVTGDAAFFGTELYYYGNVTNASFDIEDDISFTGSIYMIVKDGNHDPM